MPDLRLKFSAGEITPKDGVTTLGRTTDNDVAFPDDSNVSRFHAEIEARGQEFCLIDLNSSNGTTVNGVKVSGETYLKPGDRIMLGGSSEIVFEETREDEAEENKDPVGTDTGSPVNLPPVGAAVQQLPSLAAASSAGGSRTMLMVAGGAVLVAVVVVGVAGAIYYRSSTSSCDAKAVIVNPEPGETILKPTEIEVRTENTECVAKAIFTLDGKEFASTDKSPFTTTLDPGNHPDEADGENHSLGIVLVDEAGTLIPQEGVVKLVLETHKVEKPEDKPEEPEEPGRQQPGPAGPKGKEVTIVEIQEMTTRLAKQLPGSYSAPNKQFLLDVHKRTGDYLQEGYYERAAVYRDAINLKFRRDKNIPSPLGFVLAMSRSRFDPRKQGDEEGLWRMSQALIGSQNFGGQCEGESMSDPKQMCAATASAAYLKELLFTACGDDFMCAAAAFGKTVQEASVWRSNLPNKGADLWNSLKSGPEREQLVRFFAAGIVAENPPRFGLKRDKPISGLYP